MSTTSTAPRSDARLDSELAVAQEALEQMSVAEQLLRERLLLIDEENRRILQNSVDLETRNIDLTQLYVAAARLHETLDRQEVLTAIQEIVINLVGSEELAVFEASRDGRRLTPIHSFGVRPASLGEIALGEDVIGRSVAERRLFMAEKGSLPLQSYPGRISACVPLCLEDRLTGAIALYGLLGHKPGFTAFDREMFEMLRKHAAVALYSTALHDRYGRLDR